MSLPQALTEALAAEHLFVAGMAAASAETILLLSPDEPGFWDHVTAEPEFADGRPDPLDCWSKRVIGALATAFGGRAIFPSDGPPYPPFFAWATESGQAFPSPVQMLAHPRMGLWTSFRGALALPEQLPCPPASKHPCSGCAAPCATACPCGALSAKGYDVPTCHAFLNTGEGENCLSAGCLVRRSCPPGQSYGRLEAQSAWHMRHFHR